MTKIKLLVVDDSALMRKLMAGLFAATGEFEVQTGRDGAEALHLLQTFQPDVMTLDVHMPGMDGLACLERIMLERPIPVVMVSSLSRHDRQVTIDALALGAVDYVAKPDGALSLGFSQMEADLLRIVHAAAHARIRRSQGLLQRLRQANAMHQLPADVARTGARRRARQPLSGLGLVMIGLSTGGPRTLDDILPQLPEDFPWPIVIAQHMPARFTAALAQRLDQQCAVTVREIDQPMLLKPGHVYIGRGDADIQFSQRPQGLCVMPRPVDTRYLWHPSVDGLVQSALQFYPPTQLIGVLMTGMGYDGAAQMATLHQQGGRTIAESEESAVVFGMPAELIARQGATRVLPAQRVARQLCAWLLPAGNPAGPETPADSERNDQ